MRGGSSREEPLPASIQRIALTPALTRTFRSRQRVWTRRAIWVAAVGLLLCLLAGFLVGWLVAGYALAGLFVVVCAFLWMAFTAGGVLTEGVFIRAVGPIKTEFKGGEDDLWYLIAGGEQLSIPPDLYAVASELPEGTWTILQRAAR